MALAYPFLESNMSLRVIGALVLVLSLIGGGLEVGDVSLPYLSAPRLVLLGLLGAVLLIAGIALEGPRHPQNRSTKKNRVHMNFQLSLGPHNDTSKQQVETETDAEKE